MGPIVLDRNTPWSYRGRRTLESNSAAQWLQIADDQRQLLRELADGLHIAEVRHVHVDGHNHAKQQCLRHRLTLDGREWAHAAIGGNGRPQERRSAISQTPGEVKERGVGMCALEVEHAANDARTASPRQSTFEAT